MRSTETINFNARSIKFYIEDYCAVLSLASDTSADPPNYIILTRPSSQINGGDPCDDYDWELSIDYNGDIDKLNSFEFYSKEVLSLVFNNGAFILNLSIKESEADSLKNWLDFVFHEA
ncbi:hypothetical protein [Ottowia thiooxydans]|uniref:hypothetical protein n=1 Tax=Ottowia thiooxydans TaxID=219182 RepID=UPI0012EB52AC|nr:hypothetical protein [Ottowia thiooxydans]